MAEDATTTPFVFLFPSDAFSFMLPYRAGAVTFVVSVLLATATSFLLTVVRHLICIYGATISRSDGVSSTDFLPREDGIVPLFSDVRFMWRFGGIRRRPHIIVSIVAIIMLYVDAFAISGVVANANCAFGTHAVVGDPVPGMCLDADPAGNGDAQIGRAAAILQRQRDLGFPVRGVPGQVSTDAELQVYYPGDCGRSPCPAADTQTVSGCAASPWRAAAVRILFVSANTSLHEFRMGPDDTYIPDGYPLRADFPSRFTAVLGSPTGKGFDSSGRAFAAPIFTLSQTLRNGDDRSASFASGYVDLREGGFSGDTFTLQEGTARLFSGTLRYRTFDCARVGERPVIWVTSGMLRDASALRAKAAADAGDPCWEGSGDACAARLDDVFTAGLASLLGVGSACQVPLVRARTCTGIRTWTIAVLGSTAALALCLAVAGAPFYRKAKKRTGYWHHSVDKFVEVVCKTADGRTAEKGFGERRPAWVRAPMAGKATVWTLSSEAAMRPEVSLAQREDWGEGGGARPAP